MSMVEINEAMMNTMLKGAEGAWKIGSRVEKSFTRCVKMALRFMDK